MMTTYYGIDIGGTSVKTALLREDGTMIDKRSFDTDPERGLEDFSARLKTSFEQSLKATGLSAKDVVAGGAGVPGFLDVVEGVVVEAVNLGWHNVPFVKYAQDVLQLPVSIENDANVAALGESWVGSGRGAKSVLFVTVGTGVGGGIVIDGKLYRGVNGMGGEIGHLAVKPQGGYLCNCGKHGCLETLASATAIIRHAQEMQAEGKLPRDVAIEGAEEVFRLAEAGNQEAANVVSEAGHWLGYGLALCAIVLNPDSIVIGGGVSKAKDLLLNPVREAFEHYSLPLVIKGAKLSLATLGNDAGVIGAARVAAHAYQAE